MLDLILLQTEVAEPQGNQWSFWIMLILIFVGFYFFMIRPKSKKQKELEKQRDSMNAEVSNAELAAKHNGKEESTSVVTSTPSEFSFCTSCGAKVPKGAKFCPSCGTPQNA